MRAVHASPDFVPHEQWDRYAWLLPLEHGDEPWYYAAPRDDPPQRREVPTDPRFLATVDPAVRDLVAWLHSRGIPTGPSCSGHDITKRAFREIHDGLERDRDLVRTTGLQLRDPEDGEIYTMRDEGYELPWVNFGEFRRRAEEHQPVGWLPFYTTDPRASLALGVGHGFQIKPTGPDAYAVRTESPDPGVWERAGAVLRRALG